MKPVKPPRLTRSELLDKLAAECVEEILWETGREGGRTWFAIIRNKMEALHGKNEQETR